MVTADRGALAAYVATHRCRVPVIAAVHGHALGGGLAMVGACDIVPSARELALTVAARNPAAMRMAMGALNGIEPVDLEKNHRYGKGFTFEISHLADASEARRACVERRDAKLKSGS